MIGKHRNFAINITFVVLLAILLGAYAFLATPVATSAPAVAATATPAAEATTEAEEYEYHFVMVSHIGANDPNAAWLTFAIAEFEKRFPEVTIDYVEIGRAHV